MVRDGTPFYDPLGLGSEGTQIDFQVQVNSYLYGTRFMTWLGRRYSPERVIDWVSRRDGSRAYYATQFKQVFGTSLEQAWAAWETVEGEVHRRTLAASRASPGPPSQPPPPRAPRRGPAARPVPPVLAATGRPGLSATLPVDSCDQAVK